MIFIYDSYDCFNIVGLIFLGDCCDYIEIMVLVIVVIDNGKDLIFVLLIVD